MFCIAVLGQEKRALAMDSLNQNKLQHLEMIQGVINRMAHTSFLLKGWSVVLVSAMFAVSAHNARPNFALLAYFPALIFWGLDAYYLMQERLFRDLYDRIRKLDPTEVDFSMATSTDISRRWLWGRAVFSKTLIAYHLVIVVTILIVMFSIRG